jgi:hypothetical protein
MQGTRSAFHLPVRQAILRSEAHLNVRRNKPAPCLTRGRMKETPQMGAFQQPAYSKQRVDIRFIRCYLRLYQGYRGEDRKCRREIPLN